MIELVFDSPVWITATAVILCLCVFALVGLFGVRRRVLPRLRVGVEDSEFIGTMVQCVMVFYGLAVALIAVSVSETYSDVSKIVSQEATALAALYRDVSGYPEPIRPRLQGELREYTRYVIDEAWPMQQRGEHPRGGVERMNRFQEELIAFEPISEGQKLLHGEALRAYNHLIEARRLRLDAVGTKLPTVMWAVIVAGALIGLSATFFFRVDDARLHAMLVTLLAIFVGLIVFMILVLDRPFRGELGIGAQPYELIYDQLMKP